MSDIRKRRSKKSGIIPREIIADERTLLNWISDHSTKLAYGLAAVLLVLILIVGIFWVKGRNARIAQEDLNAALRFYWATNASLPSGDSSQDSIQLEQALANFKDVAENHENSVHGLTASLYQAGVLFRLGRYDKAALILEGLQSEDRAVFSDLNARLLLARCYEAQGEFEKAIDVYGAMAENAVGDIKALIMMDLARCNELSGKTDQAISLYTELMERFPESVFWVRAGKKLATLGVLNREEL